MLNDADCGFCTRTAALVPRLGVDIDRSTVQSADLAALGVDEDRAMVEMPYVHPDGRVEYGHRAFAAILRTGPLPWRLVGRLMTTRPVDALARRAYHWVAANRSRLPGGTVACSIDAR
ncbi:Predicted thiol-disulfide oxidoreductase YuxK, DCC family [Auraticoccus monumenti]|uniref:Predicted thiol-disulfide oxidoreductase YuxK, DCC family n=2 Tax=Auraticoccus monumenti TaxID=675864 RepID=A0A1G7CGZ0_9ACTN|nr:Predicted thiol-disulfide oxidoreductase YuxK, DCC family [Auraticoccus monumenti]